MNEYVQAYIKDHETAWAPSTLKSELARLRRLNLSLTPAEQYEQLMAQGKKPYTIKTTFIRICALESWAKLEPKYQDWTDKHDRRFKHSYDKEEVRTTYEDAERIIMGIEGRARDHALGLLRSGVRLSESYDIDDGRVVGKGGKPRKVYGTIKETVPKATLARKLKAVGLKPHTLRKLCATRLAERGATAADLCKVFGWSSIETAYQYLMPREDKKLEEMLRVDESDLEAREARR